MSLVADYSDSDGEEDVTPEGDDAAPAEGPDLDDLSTSATRGNLPEGANFLMPDPESDSSPESDPEDEVSRTRKQNLMKLDNPFRTFGDVNVAKEDSVFRNPFRDKEEERIAVLERHVKMTQNPGTALTINGKKICWNYRKRKCYLGTQCPYAHDSDVPLTEEQLKEQKLENDLHRTGLINNSSIGVGIQPNPITTPTAAKTHLPGTASAVAGGYDSSAFFSSPHLGGGGAGKEAASANHSDEDDGPSSGSTSSRKRVRVGLKNNSLIPPKKALHLYNTTKDRKC